MRYQVSGRYYFEVEVPQGIDSDHTNEEAMVKAREVIGKVNAFASTLGVVLETSPHLERDE